MKLIHPHALFRLSVLGPLASRDRLEQGDLKAILRELAARSYAIPDTKRVYLSEKTIEGWFYAWKRGGIDALTPKPRSDRGISKISGPLQEVICSFKKENPRRSLRRDAVGPGVGKLITGEVIHISTPGPIGRRDRGLG